MLCNRSMQGRVVKDAVKITSRETSRYNVFMQAFMLI